MRFHVAGHRLEFQHAHRGHHLPIQQHRALNHGAGRGTPDTAQQQFTVEADDRHPVFESVLAVVGAWRWPKKTTLIGAVVRRWPVHVVGCWSLMGRCRRANGQPLLGRPKGAKQHTHVDALHGHGLHATRFFGACRHQRGERFQSFQIAAGQEIGEAIAQVPRVQGAHAQHRQQHSGQQQQGLGVGKAKAHGTELGQSNVCRL